MAVKNSQHDADTLPKTGMTPNLMDLINIQSIRPLPDLRMEGEQEPPATPPVQPTPAAKVDDATESEWFQKLDPPAQAYIKSLRGEAKERRIDHSKTKEELQTTKAKLDQIEREQREAHEAKLKEQNDFKTLAELKESQLKETIQRANKQAIDTEIKMHALENGIPASRMDKVLKLIERNGISIDESGSIQGAADAIARLKSSDPEFFQVLASKPGSVAEPGAGAAGTREAINPADLMLVPGTNVTYGAMKKLMEAQAKTLGSTGAGDPPPTTTTPPAKKLDFRKMTKAEAAAAEKEYMAKLSKTDAHR